MEVACPADVNVSDKEDEKVLKYQALAREVSLVPSICGHHSYCIWSLWDSVLSSDCAFAEGAILL